MAERYAEEVEQKIHDAHQLEHDLHETTRRVILSPRLPLSSDWQRSEIDRVIQDRAIV